jgi:hypothetical protein
MLSISGNIFLCGLKQEMLGNMQYFRAISETTVNSFVLCMQHMYLPLQLTVTQQIEQFHTITEPESLSPSS